MRFTLVAVAAGLLVGVITGGRPRYLGDRSFRLFPVLMAGVVLQVIGSWMGSAAGVAVLLASYLALLAFAAANASIVGMWLVALGIALNFLVIAVNGGMPVRPAALVAAGIADPEEVHDLDLGGKRHLERPSDRLTGIADTYPIRPLAEVLSFGDIALNVGLANVIVHLMRPVRSRRTPEAGPARDAGLGPADENGERGADGRGPLLPARVPGRGLDRGREVAVGPGAARLRGAHRRR